jgi:hypothetical protein
LTALFDPHYHQLGFLYPEYTHQVLSFGNDTLSLPADPEYSDELRRADAPEINNAPSQQIREKRKECGGKQEMKMDHIDSVPPKRARLVCDLSSVQI